jgi:hypothetical protein
MALKAYGICLPWALVIALACLSLFAVLFVALYLPIRRKRSFYFDAQDFLHREGQETTLRTANGRELPLSARQGTFEPYLKKYIGVVKLLVTVAAASIAFGPSQAPADTTFIPKVVLAFAVLYGVVFGALLLFFYEQYAQNVRSYRPLRYALIQALGFSCLVCFIAGYVIWALRPK